ncbi:MAG TPA: tetratricopeptide repeat protein [Terriglobales bacterium]
MEVEQQSAKNSWSGGLAYSMAGICLLVGVAAGYLIHGPNRAVVAASASDADVNQPAAIQMPSPDQLKHMADKKVEPVLGKLKEDPNDPVLLAEAAKTYLYAHQVDTAIEYYEKSVKIKPDPKVLTTLGGAYHFSGNDDAALDAWNRALKIDPDFADALVNIGLVQLQSKANPEAAIEAWSRMLKSNPNHPQRAKVEKMIAGARKQLKAN